MWIETVQIFTFSWSLGPISLMNSFYSHHSSSGPENLFELFLCVQNTIGFWILRKFRKSQKISTNLVTDTQTLSFCGCKIVFNIIFHHGSQVLPTHHSPSRIETILLQPKGLWNNENLHFTLFPLLLFILCFDSNLIRFEDVSFVIYLFIN